MKIFKSQYFFYILLSALLVVLGISFIPQNKRSLGGLFDFQMNARAIIELCLTYNEAWNKDETYGGYTIYAPHPSLTVTVGTYNTDYANNLSPWRTATANTDTTDTGVLTSEASSLYDGFGWLSYSLNSNYSATVELTGANGNKQSSTGGFLAGRGTYTGRMWVYMKTATSANYYHKTTENGSYVRYKYSTEELYGSSNADWYNYSTPTGMHMNGWKVGSSSGTLVEGHHTPRIYTTGDNYFYINYSYNKYDVAFNGNGAMRGSVDTLEDCTYQSYFTMPENGFERPGYRFIKWNTMSDGSGTDYYPGTKYKNLTSRNGGYVTLYAQWEPIKYYVQFNANGGSGTMDNQQLTYGRSEKLNTNLFTRAGSGLCFGGWKKTASGSSSNYTQGSYYIFNLSTTENATVNLYVHWIKEKYNLVFDYLDQSTIVTYGQSYTFPTPARTGYIFKGWYQPTLNYTFGGTGRIPDFGNDGSTNTIIEVPFQAIWEPIEYNINFLGNTQTSGDPYSMVKQYDTPTRIIANRYRKAGYNHIGWSINEAKAPITSEDSVWQQSLPLETWFRIDNYYIQNTTWTSSRNSTFQQGGDIYFVTGSDVDDGSFSSLINSHGDSISVYSVWEAVDYQLVFDGNNATHGSMENQARIYDVRKALPSNTFERNGYLFLGWHRDKDLADAGQVEYNNLQSITNIQYFDQETKTSRTVVEGDEVTLYAVWKETWAVHNQKPSGSGSTTDPYLIANAQNLAWLSWKYEEGTSFDNGTTTPVCVQTANIDLSEYEWLPIGNIDNSFMGVYDGNGYVITNIQTNLITGISRTNIGLFGYSKSGTIKNVRIWGNINGNSNVGGILGYGLSVTIENCTNNATVIGTVDAGGIVDYIKGGKITSCYNYGNITGWTNSLGTAGGIVAYGEGVIISKCYSTGTISAGYSGGIAGIIQSGKEISSSVFEGTVYGKYSGAISGFLSNVTITNCFVKGQTENKSNKGLYAQSSNTVKFLNCIIDVNGFKGYTGTDFSNWIISSDGRPLPSGLSWLAIGGTKVTDISQISANYTKF